MNKKLTPIGQTLKWIDDYRKQNGGDYPQPDEIEAQLFMQKEAEREAFEDAYQEGMKSPSDISDFREASDYFTNNYQS